MKEVEGEFLENKDKDFIAFYDNFAGDRDAGIDLEFIVRFIQLRNGKT
ncbi:hypothetical protein SDC49_15700 [Lactobacillus sp. R2/2]|nr:hypothetical protein [Lactobacillus sp. R2/2]